MHAKLKLLPHLSSYLYIYQSMSVLGNYLHMVIEERKMDNSNVPTGVMNDHGVAASSALWSKSICNLDTGITRISVA